MATVSKLLPFVRCELMPRVADVHSVELNMCSDGLRYTPGIQAGIVHADAIDLRHLHGQVLSSSHVIILVQLSHVFNCYSDLQVFLRIIDPFGQLVNLAAVSKLLALALQAIAPAGCPGQT